MEWVSVGALGEAFAPDNNSLQYTADLAGKTVVLHFEDGSVIEYAFLDGRSLHWKNRYGGRGGAAGEESYSATSPRDGIYFVDFISSTRACTSVSLVLDLKLGLATSVTGQMPAVGAAEETLLGKVRLGKPLTGVRTEIVTGTIDRPFDPVERLQHTTCELVGKRVRYTYSPTETYEHIYLNPEFYTWHCMSGVEKGLCDTDRCHYYKIATNLYLFVWREKIVPTLGVVMIDLDRLKTTGKIFGYSEFDSASLTNFGIGAHARVVNTTEPGL